MNKARSTPDARTEVESGVDASPGSIHFSCSDCVFEGTVEDVATLLAIQQEHRTKYSDAHVLEFDQERQ